jgi:2-polyprenyl-6-methoxyphenol hydroxylase-like FAD-dependent oxidoreductase
MRESQTEVLVVGAGPVGLWTAVLLARAGVQVSIIDREPRTTTRSYACALHPATLRLLEQAQLLEPILEQGRRIDKLVFYDETGPRAELPFSAVDSKFPFLLVVPQSVLEGALEERLRNAGVRVLWNHRFDSLAHEPELVSATVERLGGTGTGYIVPHWETVVKDRTALLAQFVIGADGYNSRVRQALGIEYERFAGTTSFAAFEFETDHAPDPELRVVLSSTTNVLWPLAGQKCRWTFQIVRSELAREFPEKERRSARFAQTNVDERIRGYVQKVASQRAPWFTGSIQEIAWCTEVSFEQRLAKQFGRDRCWLLGDAAHQTGPAGVQSMNAGFAEAALLVPIIAQLLRQQGGFDLLSSFNEQQHANWQRLLGLTGGLKPTAGTHSWVRDNTARILPCLPASGPEVRVLAAQLKVEIS